VNASFALFASLGIALLVAPSVCRAEAGGSVAEPSGATSEKAEARNPPPADGRWRRSRSPQPAFVPAEESLEVERMLEALGYAAGSREATAEAIISSYEQGAALPGVNLFSSGHAPAAYLIDMKGNVLHEWRIAFDQIWSVTGDRRPPNSFFWRRVHVSENGDLLGIFANLGLVKIDVNSELIWAVRFRAHHDLEVMPNGDIYVLGREGGVIPDMHPTEPSIEDVILVLDSEGKEKRRVSVLRTLQESPYASIFARRKPSGDLLHTNSLEVLDGRIAGALPAFAAGSVLTSMRVVDAIAVIDMDDAKVIWAHEGSFRKQHDPKILPNGNLMLFDNRWKPGRSRVIEIDPVSGQTAWEYVGSPERPFFSATCGTAQRLVNGNTLITESDNGRAFEVTPDRRIVWEFHSPHRAGENGEFVATLFEVVRLAPDFGKSWWNAAGPRR